MLPGKMLCEDSCVGGCLTGDIGPCEVSLGKWGLALNGDEQAVEQYISGALSGSQSRVSERSHVNICSFS